MAVNTRNSIVTNGLVLALDAGNPKSYTAGSTIWNDISAFKAHMTLVNGPTFTNQGAASYISFNAVSQYGSTTVSVPDSTAGDRCSFECWSYGPMTNNTMLMAWGTAIHDIYLVNNGIGFNTYNGDVYGVATTPLINVWNHYVINFYRGDYTLGSIYINGIPQTLSYYSPGQNPANARFAGGALRIAAGGDGYFGIWRFNSVRVYNRALSAAEVLQNYNATKTRFRL